MSSQDPVTIAQAEEMQQGLTAQITALGDKIDDLSNVLTGEDPFHPNGLQAKVKRNTLGIARLKTEDIAELKTEWREFKASAKGFAVGIGLSSAVIGGGVATLANRLFGSG